MDCNILILVKVGIDIFVKQKKQISSQKITIFTFYLHFTEVYYEQNGTTGFI